MALQIYTIYSLELLIALTTGGRPVVGGQSVVPAGCSFTTPTTARRTTIDHGGGGVGRVVHHLQDGASDAVVGHRFRMDWVSGPGRVTESTDCIPRSQNLHISQTFAKGKIFEVFPAVKHRVFQQLPVVFTGQVGDILRVATAALK